MRFSFALAGCLVFGSLAHGQTPSPQYPAPPLPQPGFSTPPTPSPAAAPAPHRAPALANEDNTGEIEQTTRARGAAIVNNGGTVIYQSPGVSTPAASAYPVRAAAPVERAALPPSLIALFGRRLAGATYYAATGRCPTGVVLSPAPAETGGFSTPPSAAPQRSAAPQPQEVVVRVVHEQAPTYAPGPSASPQQVIAQPVKRWSLFHHNP